MGIKLWKLYKDYSYQPRSVILVIKSSSQQVAAGPIVLHYEGEWKLTMLKLRGIITDTVVGRWAVRIENVFGDFQIRLGDVLNERTNGRRPNVPSTTLSLPRGQLFK